jgi:arginine-tRNA-protein transferase
MKVYEGPRLGPEESCPYLDDRQSRHEFMLAAELKDKDWESLMRTGWRRFGLYFFRPKCTGCLECKPLRVPLPDWTPSKSQRRILNKNKDLDFQVAPKKFNPEIFDLYQKHTRLRFPEQYNPNETHEDFWLAHYTPAMNSFQSEIYFEDKLIALGLIDPGTQGLSSSYFFFDPDLVKRSLGIYGALKEMLWAQKQNYKYYYLGYWVKGNKSMDYKAQFRPHEIYNWSLDIWEMKFD